MKITEARKIAEQVINNPNHSLSREQIYEARNMLEESGYKDRIKKPAIHRKDLSLATSLSKYLIKTSSFPVVPCADDKEKTNEIERIAKVYLFIKTLEIQNNDSLDFYELSVVSIKQALTAAYEAGKKSAE